MYARPSAQAIVASLNAKFSPLTFYVGWDIRYGAKGRRTRLWHIDVVVPGAGMRAGLTGTAVAMPCTTAGAMTMPMATAATMMVDTTGDGRPDQVVQVAPAAPVQPTMVMATPVVVQAIPVQANRV